MATELKRLFKEIKELSLEERRKLKRLLDKHSADDRGEERFARAAGSWSDLDAEEYITRTYANRSIGGHRRPGGEPKVLGRH